MLSESRSDVESCSSEVANTSRESIFDATLDPVFISEIAYMRLSGSREHNASLINNEIRVAQHKSVRRWSEKCRVSPPKRPFASVKDANGARDDGGK